jgi:hypothetical protein
LGSAHIEDLLDLDKLFSHLAHSAVKTGGLRALLQIAEEHADPRRHMLIEKIPWVSKEIPSALSMIRLIVSHSALTWSSGSDIL